MTPAQLRAYSRWSRLGSVRAAAAELGPDAGVSMHVAALRKELDDSGCFTMTGAGLARSRLAGCGWPAARSKSACNNKPRSRSPRPPTASAAHVTQRLRRTRRAGPDRAPFLALGRRPSVER